MSISFKMTLPQKLLKYREYSRHFWVDSFQNKRQKTQRNLIDNVLRFYFKSIIHPNIFWTLTTEKIGSQPSYFFNKNAYNVFLIAKNLIRNAK